MFIYFLFTNNYSTQNVLSYLRYISWKLEVPSLENQGEDIILVIFQISEKIYDGKIAVYTFV